MPNGQQSAIAWLTNSAIIIALITGAAYFWTVRYEIGWHEHFQIPRHFISLNLTNILDVSGSLNIMFMLLAVPLLITMLIWNTSLRWSYRLSQNHPVLWFFIGFAFYIIGYFLTSWQIKDESPVFFWATCTIVVLMIIFIALYPLRLRRQEGSYISAFLVFVRRSNQSEPTEVSLPQAVIDAVIISAIAIWVYFGAYSAYWRAKDNAKAQQVFSVVDQYPGVPEVVLLRTYGDYFIAVPLVRSTTPKKVKREVYLLKISKVSNIPIKTEKLGRLEVKP